MSNLTYILIFALLPATAFSQWATVDPTIEAGLTQVADHGFTPTGPDREWPDCVSPNRITVDVLSHESCLITWEEAPQTHGVSYQIQYRIRYAGETPGRVEEIATRKALCTISSLRANSIIDFRVRAICAADSTLLLPGEWMDFIIANGEVLNNPGTDVCDKIESSVRYYYDNPNQLGYGARVCWSMPEAWAVGFTMNTTYSVLVDSTDAQGRDIYAWDFVPIDSLLPHADTTVHNFCQWVPADADSVAINPEILRFDQSVDTCGIVIVPIRPPTDSICQLASFLEGVSDNNGYVTLSVRHLSPDFIQHFTDSQGTTTMTWDVQYYDASIPGYTTHNADVDLTSAHALSDWSYTIPIANYDYTNHPVSIQLNHQSNGVSTICTDVLQVDVQPDPLILDDNPICDTESQLVVSQIDSTLHVIRFEDLSEQEILEIITNYQIDEVYFDITYTSYTDCDGSHTEHIESMTIHTAFMSLSEWATLIHDLGNGMQNIAITMSFFVANTAAECHWDYAIDNSANIQAGDPSHAGLWKSGGGDCDSTSVPVTAVCDLIDVLAFDWLSSGTALIRFDHLETTDFATLFEDGQVTHPTLSMYYATPDSSLGAAIDVIALPSDLSAWSYAVNSIDTLQTWAAFQLSFEYGGQVITCNELAHIELGSASGNPNIQLVCDLANFIVGSELSATGVALSFIGISEHFFEDVISFNDAHNMWAEITYWDAQLNQEVVRIEDFVSDGAIEQGADWSALLYNVDTSVDIALRMHASNADSTATCERLVVVSFDTDPPLDDDDIPLETELPLLECGNGTAPPAITNFEPMRDLLVGDVVYMAEFPILIASLSGDNGTYSGSGSMRLPFGNRIVSVEFTNVEINELGEIWQGQVDGIAADPADYPDFSLDTLSVGGEICIPSPEPGVDADNIDPVTGLDPHGFSPIDSIHSETGTTFDPLGFDIEGIHYETGTIYNPNGCTRDGIDTDGQPCDPAAGSSNPTVNAFIDSVQTEIPTEVSNCVQALIATLQDTLSILNTNCQTLRSDMQVLVNDLGYADAYLFGANDEFFDAGMYVHFEQQPHILQLQTDRDPQAADLESKHVDLYHCDKGYHQVQTLLDIIGSKNEQEIVDYLIEVLQAEATSYLVEEVFSDPVKFKNWIRKKIAELLNGDYEEQVGESIGYWERPKAIEIPIVRRHAPSEYVEHHPSPYYDMASSNSMLYQPPTAGYAEESYLFKQGFTTIKGVHRAFYLQELSRQMALLSSADDPLELLPIQISKDVAGKALSIYLDNLVVTPVGASISAYFLIEDPNSGKRVVFEATGVQFTADGLSAPSQLQLATTVELRLNNSAKLILNANNQTFVRWDCDGFLDMTVDLDVEFCREFIKPYDLNAGNVIPDPERVRVNILHTMSDWLNFTLTVNVPPFVLNQHEDMVWEVAQATIDLSDTATPAISLLPGYASPHKVGNGLAPAWKGVHIGQLSVTMPNSFSNNAQGVTVGAQNALIDGSGVSGSIFAQNLVPIEAGSLDGWAFSIEEFNLLVLHNHPAGAGLKGELNVPIFEENFRYTANMFPGNRYSFSVEPTENMTMPMWMAQAKICKNSTIEADYTDGVFHAVATLNGHIDVVPDNASLPLNIELPRITFQGFRVSNQTPYFDAGTWGFDTAGPSLLNGFQCGIGSLRPFSNTSNEAGLAIQLDVQIGPKYFINALGDLHIVGSLDTTGQHHWSFDRLELGSLYVDASFPGAHITGGLDPFDDDPTFGTGFRGALSAKFDFLPIRMTALGQFGDMDTYKYFMVDAMADTNIPTGIAGLNFKGFGGGIAHRMSADPNATLNLIGDPSIPPLGQSISGVVYVPDATRALTFKGLAVIATAKEELFNGTVGLDIGFNEPTDEDARGGIAEIALRGTGKFLTGIDFGIPALFSSDPVSPPPINAKLSAYIDMAYNFGSATRSPSFDGTLGVFLNAGVLQGVGPGGRLCVANMHFGSDDWFIWIGKPEPYPHARCGAILDIGPIDAALTAYFNVGTRIPPFPKIHHHQLQDIARKLKMDESLRGSGAGIMFGADFEVNVNATVAGTGVEASAGAGFDLMLRRFEDAICIQTGQPIGVDGWYAIGQVWAFLEASVKLFGIKVFGAGIAAALHARGPNPFYAHALLRVRACALFLCKTFNIDIELGENCVLTSSNPNDDLGIEVISHFNPAHQSTDIGVDAELSTFTTLGIGKKLTIGDLNGNEVEFVPLLGHIHVTDSQGNLLDGHIRMENKNKHLIFRPHNLLPEFDTITIETAIIVYKNGDSLTTEIKSATFTTSRGYDVIPESNVEASYPLDGMYNFYRRESNAHVGYIELVAGQPDLMYDLPEGTSNKVRLQRGNGETYVFDFEFNPYANTIEFPLDPNILVPDARYKLEIVRVVDGDWQPYTPGASSNAGAMQVPPSLGGTIGMDLQVGGLDDLDGVDNTSNDTDRPTEKVLYQLYFRVSQYDDVATKIDAIMAGAQTSIQTGNPQVPGGTSTTLYKDITPVEPFDEIEIRGNAKYDPLLTFSTDVDNVWYRDHVHPVVYEDFPLTLSECQETINYSDHTYRSVETGGTGIVGGYHQLDEMRIGVNNFWDTGLGAPVEQRLAYRAAAVAQGHFVDLMFETSACVSYILDQNSDVAGDPSDHVPQELIDFQAAVFADLSFGTYKSRVKYKLPLRALTTAKRIEFTHGNTGN